MKNTILFSTCLAFIAITMLSLDPPKNWFKAGDHPASYEMGIDKGAGQNGENVATIKSIEPKIDGFGTLMQSCSPQKFLGKKVKMTGMLKCENVRGWTGFWMRVDGEKGKAPLDFDNMQDRSITKTTSWKKYEITLNVSDKATNLAYGVLLAGEGQVWFTNFSFEIVGDADGSGHRDLSKLQPLEAPSNLDFKE